MVDLSRDHMEDLGNQDATGIAVVGNTVYDPLIFQPGLVKFTRKQYLFLNAYRLGTPIQEACLKSDLTVEQADRFLKKPMTVQWLQDRAKKDHIRNEWHEPGKWWEMGDAVLNGERKLSKDQQIVFMAFGDRVCPKEKVTVEGSKGPTINFNFGADAVKEAFKRQEIIEAEIAKESAA